MKFPLKSGLLALCSLLMLVSLSTLAEPQNSGGKPSNSQAYDPGANYNRNRPTAEIPPIPGLDEDELQNGRQSRGGCDAYDATAGVNGCGSGTTSPWPNVNNTSKPPSVTPPAAKCDDPNASNYGAQGKCGECKPGYSKNAYGKCIPPLGPPPPPPPPNCPPGSTYNGSTCVTSTTPKCKWDETWNGSQCVSLKCQDPGASNYLWMGSCVYCPAQHEWNGSYCQPKQVTCNDSGASNYGYPGQCVHCNSNQFWNGSYCQQHAQPPPPPQPPTCKDPNASNYGSTWGGGACRYCRSNQFWNGSSCQTNASPPPPPPKTCPAHQRPSGNTCVDRCSSNQTWNGSSCVTNSPPPPPPPPPKCQNPSAINYGGSLPCVLCTGGRVKSGNSCVCPPGTTWNGSSCVPNRPAPPPPPPPPRPKPPEPEYDHCGQPLPNQYTIWGCQPVSGGWDCRGNHKGGNALWVCQ